ncbi:hypothetical protein K491DRAFT_779705 [Lophiostoma macrostomum CBS 122681]|uniref:NAD(P)-binding protein n=1 Tax=Lophiostoma macrostomum CBS 122681 TaxID=1314788 RepID=A0A6A6T3D9_9PLEO|nr:hypothetical protein K491DRAFT_779705 [Lophiostoma macrostomum CBS 122681]
MEREKPSFALTMLNPPFVFGAIPGSQFGGDECFESVFRGFLQGKATSTIYYAWIHVEDCALAHVKAIENGDIGNERVFLTSGEQFCHKDILDIIHEEFPQLRKSLPEREKWDGLAYPEGFVYRVDAARARELIKKDFIGLRQCVVETVDMIKKVL